MGRTSKKLKQLRREQRRKKIKIDPPDQKVLDLIGSPNIWTPEIEEIWLQELHKITAGEIYRRFPPMKKPPNVRNRGKGKGWGDSNA